MKPIVIYYSETGNTEKMGRAVANGLGIEPRRIEEVNPQELVNYDLICIGTPVHGNHPAKAIKTFMAEMPNLPRKRAAAFCTVHLGGSGRALRIMKRALEAKEIYFVGGLCCKGWSRLIANFGPRIFNKGRPNGEDLRNAEEFGRSLLSC